MDLQLDRRPRARHRGHEGIGRAIVEEFLAEGASVEFCARDETEIRDAEKALAGRGAGVRGVALDVRDGAALTSWVGRPRTGWVVSTRWWRTSARSPSATPTRTGRPASRST